MANCRSMGAKEICSLIVLILQLTVRSSYANPIKWKYVGRDGCVVQSGFVLDGRSHYDQLKAEIEHIQDAWVEHPPGLVTSYGPSWECGAANHPVAACPPLEIRRLLDDR